MRGLVTITCGLLASVLLPSVALADEDPAAPFPPALAPAPLPPAASPAAGAVTESTTATVDTVHLRSGGMFRGRVTEIIPGDHVTLLLVTGESHRVAWGDVDRVIVASTTLPPAPTAAAPVAAPMSGPRARVHVKAPQPSYLYRRPAGSSELVIACQTPCDIELPLGDTYRIGGSGFTTTGEFKLDAPPGGSVEVTVDGPSWAGIVGGGVLTLGGGVTAYVGAIFALAGSGCSSGTYNTGCKDVRNVGFGALALGAGMIALGLVIVFPSLKTDLSQQSGGSGKDAFLRTPSWRSASSASEGVLPLSFPLAYQGRF